MRAERTRTVSLRKSPKFLLAVLCGAAVLLTVGYTLATTNAPAPATVTLEPLTTSPLIDDPAPSPEHLVAEGTTSSPAVEDAGPSRAAASPADTHAEGPPAIPRP